MKHIKTHHSQPYPDPYHGVYARTVFGFWLFLVTDFILFGTLFATFIVLANSTFGGPGAVELLSPEWAAVQSFILLLASLFSGLAGAAAHRNEKSRALVLLLCTFIAGCVFSYGLFADFARLIEGGSSWDKSAFLSAFFTVLGTHAIHIIFAVLWIPVLAYPLFKEKEVSQDSKRRITCLRMFWQFLNIIWIFIFAIVFFMGRG
jgi:cytochrome o ubiquinol oxidase subunit 3